MTKKFHVNVCGITVSRQARGISQKQLRALFYVGMFHVMGISFAPFCGIGNVKKWGIGVYFQWAWPKKDQLCLRLMLKCANPWQPIVLIN